MDEERFMWMLREKDDSEVKYIVCMWQNSCTEFLLANFRKLLQGASTKNAEYKVISETQMGLHFMRKSKTV